MNRIILSKLVGPYVLAQGAFNEYEPSLHHGDAVVYLGRISDASGNAVNLAIIEKRGPKRTDWSFGTFPGKHSGECESDSELKEFFEKLDKIIKTGRLPSADLEKTILKHIEQINDGVERST